jgi:hypothetical protein
MCQYEQSTEEGSREAREHDDGFFTETEWRATASAMDLVSMLYTAHKPLSMPKELPVLLFFYGRFHRYYCQRNGVVSIDTWNRCGVCNSFAVT